MEHFKYSYKTENDDNILVNIYNSGYQKCHSNYSVGPLVRKNYLIHHVVSGKGKYIVNEKVYNISKGDTFLIYPNTVVSYCADENHPWEYYWVGFGGIDVKTLIDKTDFSKNNCVIHTNKENEIKETLLQIYNASGEEFYKHIKMIGYLYQFLSILIEESKHKPEGIDISQSYTKKAIDFICENYNREINVTDIASFVGISRSHLYKIFTKHLSVSPKNYLDNFRIMQAKELLERTNFTINEVASMVGFDDQLHFSKSFKKIVKKSPKQYKNDIISNKD